MHEKQLAATATQMIAPGKGLLAADESTPTMAKRLAQVGLDNTVCHRLSFRQALFETTGLEEFISAVILFEETLEQRSPEGRRLTDILLAKGILPGIKVDQGTQVMPTSPSETTTRGLDDLPQRCERYHRLGARFAKWRAVITIGPGLPTTHCINANAEQLARYAAIAQNKGLVPIVEPEVLMEGSHTIDTCYEVTQQTLATVFAALKAADVYLPGMLIKPNMVLAGQSCQQQANPHQVAEMTLRCLHATVPAAVPGLVFLSGGQSEIEATRNLNAINSQAIYPWALSFSFGRALQQTALRTWRGNPAKRHAAQAALLHRAKMSSRACLGTYTPALEQQASSAA